MSRIQVVILAAGRGSRMGPYTDAMPKCLVPFAGRPLVEWQLQTLAAMGLDDVTVVTGYRSEMLEALGLPHRHNPDWRNTNMVASLLCADDVVRSDKDMIVAYGDIVYEPRVLRTLIETPGDVVTAVDLDWLELWRARNDDPLSDAETLRFDENGDILEIGRRPRALEDIDGQYIGLTKFTSSGKGAIHRLMSKAESGDWTSPRPPALMHFTDLLAGLIETGDPVRAALVHGGWLEVDTEGDLKTYETLLRDGEVADFCTLPLAVS